MKIAIILLNYIVVLNLLIGTVYGGGGVDDTGSIAVEKFAEAVDSGTAISGILQSDTTVSNQGTEFDIDPGYVNYDGQDFDADGITVDVNEEPVHLTDVEGFERFADSDTAPIFHADFAAQIETPYLKAVNARNIDGYRDHIELESGDIITTDSTTLSNVTKFKGNNHKISFKTVDAIYVDKMILLALANSSFNLDNEGKLVDSDITSRIDNNTLDLKNLLVTLDKDESVHFEPGYAYSEHNVTFRYFDERVIGAAQIWLDGAMRCITLHQFSRYEQNGSINFAIAAPLQFHFCIQRKENEKIDVTINACNQCGIVNLVNFTVAFNGQVIYEKLQESFVPIIQSYDNNTVRFKTDSLLNNMTQYRIMNEFSPGNTLTLSSYFTISELKGNTYVKVGPEVPYLLREYTHNSDITLLYDAMLVQRRLNTVTLFAPGDTEYEKKLYSTSSRLAVS
jgi:hypothetical protein